MSFAFTSSGDFKKTEKFLKTLSEADNFKALDKFGRQGVAALSADW